MRRLRNETTARLFSADDNPVGLLDHWSWWISRRDRAEAVFIIVSSGRRAGYLRLDSRPDGFHCISLAVEPSARGLGIGGRAIDLAVKMRRQPMPVGWRAIIRVSNHASVAAFAKSGFNKIDDDSLEPDFVCLELRRLI